MQQHELLHHNQEGKSKVSVVPHIITLTSMYCAIIPEEAG
jgi:hypothetical protein